MTAVRERDTASRKIAATVQPTTMRGYLSVLNAYCNNCSDSSPEVKRRRTSECSSGAPTTRMLHYFGFTIYNIYRYL
jgi:hypothetical protein